jgi:hypothetical protein
MKFFHETCDCNSGAAAMDEYNSVRAEDSEASAMK